MNTFILGELRAVSQLFSNSCTEKKNSSSSSLCSTSETNIILYVNYISIKKEKRFIASLIPSWIMKEKRYCILKASVKSEFTEGSAEKLHRETQIQEWDTSVTNQSGLEGACSSNTCTEVVWWRDAELELSGKLCGPESQLYHWICCVMLGMLT